MHVFSIIVVSAIAVDPAWGAWTSFGECSASCGDGKRTRSRACEPNDDCPNCEAGNCLCGGDPVEYEEKACNEQCCTRKYLPLHTNT